MSIAFILRSSFSSYRFRISRYKARGKIVQINTEFVFIDVGYKSEGKIPIAEFPEPPQLGDTISIILVKKEGKEGSIVVSKQKADERLFWKDLKKCFNESIKLYYVFSITY